MMKRRKKLKGYIWAVHTLPKWSSKLGPLDFISKLWRSLAARVPKGTLSISPKTEPLIDIGPGCIDLWRYLKTDLFKN